MTPHRENGAKLKKETQCPCTYKNKLILLSSHCENIFVSGPKDSHTQTEASLAFLQNQQWSVTTNLCTHRRERSIYRYRGKNCATDLWAHGFSHLQTSMYSQPVRQTIF